MQEEEVKEFIRRLPDISTFPPVAVHLVMTCVRTKKTKEMMGVKVRDTVLERKIIRPLHEGVESSWKTRYLNTVHNLSLLQHEGKYDFKEKAIPFEAIGILATIAPRNIKQALCDITRENIEYMINQPDDLELAKQSSRWFGKLQMHRAPGYNFVTVDIDKLDPVLFRRILDAVSPLPIFMITETSGGYHIVLDLCKSTDAEAFFHGKTGIQKKILESESRDDVEIYKDRGEPVPGTFYHRVGSKEKFYVRLIE